MKHSGRHVCIHGHFYQPPRENPWLEAIEYQDSAYPYHDWNERVTAECYGPNSAARVLNPDGRIVDIMNNYGRISFNFGPTLLSWMEHAQPDIYAAVLEADRLGQQRYGGHGTALAQVHGHLIMPLASSRDKRTQVLWGIADFVHRFRRRPEGMWLAETAVDLETLELLAEQGIAFTLLAPRQAAAVRPLAGGSLHREGQEADADGWMDVSGERIDPRRPYLCRLHSGRSIVLFFYDGHISRELAFEGLLHNGEAFAARLLSVFTANPEDQLVHIATDGETYGHHHKMGEMALTYCLHHLEASGVARVTVYGEYLAAHPPLHEVRIHENSSWSCVHGVERWRDNCGCNTGLHGAWHQRWRKPLREALDWLGEQLAALYEEQGATVLEDPWAARDAYIEVVLDRSPERLDAFFERHAAGVLSGEALTRALRLLEMQRHAMLMYTSCGWFFDELSGIEATQVLKYASRAVQLAKDVGGPDLEDELTHRLRAAPSNLPEHSDGELIYTKFIRPAAIGMRRVAAHYAISSLFRTYAPQDSLYAFDVTQHRWEVLQAGKSRLGLGRVTVRSRVLGNARDLCFAVLHLGDHNVSGGVRDAAALEPFDEVQARLRIPFARGDVHETLRVLDSDFGGGSYSLWHLFRDEQREIINSLFDEAEERVEAFYRQVYRDYYHLVQALAETGMPLPPIFRATLEFVVNRALRQCLESKPVDEEELGRLVQDAEKWRLGLDREGLGLLGTAQIDALVQKWSEVPPRQDLMDEVARTFGYFSRLKVPLNLWRAQNTLYQVGRQQFFLRSRMAKRGGEIAALWVEHFRKMASLLEVRFE